MRYVTIWNANEREMNGTVKGRPRDPEVDARVVRAVLELLGEVGYERLTVGAIARRAQVSRPAIYRRWRSKAEIVARALAERPGRDAAPALVGDLRRDLAACVRAVLAGFGRPEVATAWLGLTGDQGERPGRGGEPAWPGRDPLAGRLAATVAGAVAAAVARGEARADVRPELAFELLAGSVLLRAAAGRPMDDPAYCEQLTNLLFHAIAAAP
jgi:AcrR family transcriptional regulator